jgi:cyclic beta-1,2-glucan synthetase
MNAVFRYVASRRRRPSLWADTAPVREELFGIERLEQHAQSLAAAQPVTKAPPVVLSLHTRLNESAAAA